MGKSLRQRSKVEVLAWMGEEFGRFERTLAGLTPEQMVQGGVEGDWSVKDVVAHIAVWQERLVGWIEQVLSGESPDLAAFDDKLEQLNRDSYLANRDRPADDIVADFRKWHHAVVALTETLPEDVLCEYGRFAWMPDGKPFWALVLGDTSAHYQEHRESIERWLAAQ